MSCNDQIIARELADGKLTQGADVILVSNSINASMVNNSGKLGACLGRFSSGSGRRWLIVEGVEKVDHRLDGFRFVIFRGDLAAFFLLQAET